MQELPNLEEFQSLPPALRRKLFSNVERFHIQLALADHGRGLDYHSDPIGVSDNFLHSPSSSVMPIDKKGNEYDTIDYYNSPGESDRLRRQKFPSSRNPARRRSSFRVSCLNPPTDAQWFLSLPSKIQQTQFSKEEQLLLCQARRQSLMLDAADESFYQSDIDELSSHPFFVEEEEEEEDCFEAPTPITVSGRPPSAFLDTSDDLDFCPSEDMNDPLLDSFRRLDGNGNLDLSLGNYRVNTPSTPSCYTSSRLSSIAERGSSSRPSLNYQPSPRVRRSASSVEPHAQYVQDPEARLKLRVYLASPQKFDEAVEFGFPALESKNQNQNQNQNQNKNKNKNIGLDLPPTETKSNKYVLAGTFFKDDDASTFLDTDEKDRSTTATKSTAQSPSAPVRYQRQKSSSTSTPSDIRRQQSSCGPFAKKPVAQRYLGDREMTMKMTLTRPDLRTESSVALPTTDDPLKLDELPPSDTSTRPPWELEADDEQGGVKKIWYKFRRRVCR